ALGAMENALPVHSVFLNTTSIVLLVYKTLVEPAEICVAVVFEDQPSRFPASSRHQQHTSSKRPLQFFDCCTRIGVELECGGGADWAAGAHGKTLDLAHGQAPAQCFLC